MFDWYKPRYRLTIDGCEWSSNGYAAYRMPAIGDDIKSPDAAALTREIERAPLWPTAKVERVNGYAIVGTCVCAEHFLALAEHMFPGVAWYVRENYLASTWVGKRNGRAVAVVMGIHRNPDLARAGEPWHPKCPACEGGGKDRECEECNGSGGVECHECGHEDDCDECDGTGRVGKCKACGGSGHYRDTPKVAAE